MKNNKKFGAPKSARPARTPGKPPLKSTGTPPLKTTGKKKKSGLSFFESKILSALKKEPERGFSSREMMRVAGLKDKVQFYASLKTLTENGHIVVDKKHIVSLNRTVDTLRATLVSLSPGFGFARPESGGDDVFIHGRELRGALVGDTILLCGVRKDAKGLSGRVLRVLSEPQDTTTGTVHFTEYGPEVIPDNSIRYNPRLTEVMEAKEGDKVQIRLLQDERGDWTHAKVIKVFGSGESARICSDAIIARYGIPTEFTPEQLAEAEAIGKRRITKQELEDRVDLRNWCIFTIDGADAKDLDDAISVTKTDAGYALGVHIADVSHYIAGKSLLDDEAIARGTSVYFADRVIPMLPEAISNGVCSLNAGVNKLCFSALMTLSPQGKLLEYRFEKTVIKSCVRGVYSEVNCLFDGSAGKRIEKKYASVMESLTTARELANILRKNAAARGTMEIDSGESRFVLDENGVCVDVLPRESGEAQELIEQLMIMANTAAARASMDADIPFLYRVHETPDPARVSVLAELLKALNIPCKALYNEKPTTGDFAQILNAARGTGAETLVSQRLLRTMEKAKYATAPLGHFGLALRDYSHFTSPIRRYPDTAIHRILTALTSGVSKEDLTRRFASFAERSATDSSKNEIRAVQAERDAEDCYMAEFMRAHIGEHFVGTISGCTRNGVFVRLANSVEGFVPTESFPNHHFVFDGVVTHRCTRSDRVLTVGTSLAIIVASAHVATGKVDFTPDEAA